MCLRMHVDKIHHDDAANIPEPELEGNGLRRFPVGTHDSSFQAGRIFKAAAVHIDDRHGFRVVDDDITAAG